MSVSLVGRTVTIKANDVQNAGNWGIVRNFDGDYYHIAIFGDLSTTLIFDRSQFTVTRKSKEKAP